MNDNEAAAVITGGSGLEGCSDKQVANRVGLWRSLIADFDAADPAGPSLSDLADELVRTVREQERRIGLEQTPR